ncbi:MAG: hypothetical protein IKC17_00965 [Bacteroidales bacterium]|nr:hypothetical protein [Bacteroidales bacterium]
MKKIFLLMLSVVALSLSSCKEKEIPEPSISLTAGEVTENTISFTVTPKDAEKCAYQVILGTAELPTDAVVLSQGVQIDAKNQSNQTVSELEPGTEYKVIVAVQNGPHQKSKTITMTTAEEVIPDPEVSVVAGEATVNTISFTVVSANADACAYFILGEEVEMTAQDVFANGVSLEVGEVEVEVENLTPDTQYFIYAAASRADEVYVVAESVSMSTLPEDAPQPIEWEYFSGQYFNDTNYILTGLTKDQSIVFLFDMYCPASEGKILPEGVYSLANEDYTFDQYSHINNSYISDGTITVEHLEEGYHIIFDITTQNGSQYEFEYSGLVADTENSGFNNPPYTEQPPVGNNCIMKGTSYGSTNYGVYVYSSESDTEYTIFLDVYCPTSTYSILPEGTYTFDAETDYYIGNWSYGPNWTSIIEGTMVVKHLENGYDISMDVTDDTGTRYQYQYSGYVAPNDQYSNFNNPPIPYNDVTYEVNVISAQGDHYGPSENFEVRLATEEDYHFYFSLTTKDVVYDGIIPEGTYAIGGEDFELNSYSYVKEGEDGMNNTLVEGSYLTVTHLSEGYSLEFHVENGLMTKFNGSYSGLITKSEYANYEFMNPGVELQADYEAVFTSGERAGEYGGGTQYVFANEEGSELKILINAYSTNPTLSAGVYGAAWGFDDEYLYTFNGNETTIKLVGVTDGMSYPLYASSGYFRVDVDPSGIYTIVADLYAYFSDGNKLFRFTYTGDLEGIAGTVTPPVESNVVVKGRRYNDTNYEVAVYDEEGNNLLYLDAYCKSSIFNILPAGEYFVDNNASYWEPSQYENYLGQYSKVKYPAEKNLSEGSMLVEHLEEGYRISFNLTDQDGNSHVYNWEGVMESYNSGVIGNPPIPYNDVTINTSVESISGEHYGGSPQYNLFVTTVDGPYELTLQLQANNSGNSDYIPEGTYTPNGTDFQLLEWSTMALNGDYNNSLKLAESSSVTVRHLAEGYEVEIAVEDLLKTKVNCTYSGLIFKSENANYNFENPGYEYPADWTVVLDQVIGENNGSDWAASWGGFIFSNADGDKISLAFNTADLDPTLKEGVYTMADWSSFNPGQYYGNGCEIWLHNETQTYAMYPTSGNVTVEEDGGIYTITMDWYVYSGGYKILRAVYTGDLYGTGGEEGGEEGGETPGVPELTGDVNLLCTIGQFVPGSYGNYLILKTEDGTQQFKFCMEKNSDFPDANSLPSGEYPRSAQYEATGYYCGGDSAVTYVDENGTRQVDNKTKSGKIVVTNDNGNYTFFVDVVLNNGLNVQGYYAGTLTTL